MATIEELRDERAKLSTQMADAAKAMDTTKMLSISTELRKNEGAIKDIQSEAEQGERDALRDSITEALEGIPSQIATLESVDTISVTISSEGVGVVYGGQKKASGGTGGGGGRGHGYSKDGTTNALGEIWDLVATAEEKLEYDGLKGDGSKQWNLRVKVAKAAGYVKAAS